MPVAGPPADPEETDGECFADGQDIADEARSDLNDTDSGNYRWSDADILRYINAGVREIINLVPEAGAVTDSMSPVTGSRQEIPTGGTKFLKVANLIIDGDNYLVGDSITEVEADALDSTYPDWAWNTIIPDEEDADNWTAHNVTHDPREPTIFHLYPTVPDDDQGVLITYVEFPGKLATLAECFPLREEYVNACVLYVKFRMVARDGRNQASPTIRKEMHDDFRSALGLKIESDKRFDPATHRPPEDSHG